MTRWRTRLTPCSDAITRFAAEYVTVMTDGRTRYAYYITDAAVAAGRLGAGRYEAVCGAVVLPASLTTPDIAGCLLCASWAQRRMQRRGM